ncbi:MAG: hypothetical protein B7Z20_07280 [Sphingobium sp. 32-64-5]|nr:MAG: hypothetical protein B7Z20_07280 [Sphingobium sp. 32-64-5]
MTGRWPRLSRRRDRLALRDRSFAIGLTLAIHIVIIFFLLWLTPDILPFRKDDQSLATFDLPAPHSGDQQAAKAQPSSESAPRARQAEATPRPTPPEPRPDIPVPQPQVEVPSMIYLSPDEFASSDIGRMKGRKGDGSANGRDAASVYGPGEGPGGAQLYNAQWRREPTSAELAGYLPSDMPRNGYGLIACQTMENFRVDHCRILGESPLGSGLGQAVRRAAWQFLVVPPRINGRPQLGAWVRIRIDYTEGVQQIR